MSKNRLIESKSLTMWFETLIGCPEGSPQQMHENLVVDGEFLRSRINGKVMACGRLETPSLAELRARVKASEPNAGRLSVREIVANVQDLHTDESNAGSLFQVASQFNLLEMVSPQVTPERGVGIYEHDLTQGPACAISAGAGTIYRNYFAPVNGKVGQSAENQIDCLADIAEALGNSENRLWKMKNGYALLSREGLIEISKRLRDSSERELDALRKRLRIGIQWNTQVTINNAKHRVSQVYCSALPVAYCNHDSSLWESFARLILEASYEATLCAAILNAQNHGNRTLFLTLLGEGAFGNKIGWIVDAIERALNLNKHIDLNVAIVSYSSSDQRVRQLIDRFSA
jgi:hypothetical protein